jgi:hypothetical protein
MLPHVAMSHQVPRWACERSKKAQRRSGLRHVFSRGPAGEFQALADRLLSPAPLPARGVAQARLLLGDGVGPLYRGTSRDDLRTRVAEAVQALDPLTGW